MNLMTVAPNPRDAFGQFWPNYKLYTTVHTTTARSLYNFHMVEINNRIINQLYDRSKHENYKAFFNF